MGFRSGHNAQITLILIRDITNRISAICAIAMAQFLHLPIYIKTYEFIKYIYKIIQQFRKEYKYTLGAEIQQIIWQILDEVIKTNSLPDNRKRDGIQKISYLFDRFKIRFRFAYEIGLMTNRKFSVAQQQIEEIGRMIGGWQRWAEIEPLETSSPSDNEIVE